MEHRQERRPAKKAGRQPKSIVGMKIVRLPTPVIKTVNKVNKVKAMVESQSVPNLAEVNPAIVRRP